MSAKRAVRIGSCVSIGGDSLAADCVKLAGDPIDVLTGDWLASLRMQVLARNRLKKPQGGYDKTFIDQMQKIMGACLAGNVKVVTNAGGLNPKSCAAAVQVVARNLGLKPRVAWIEGDDLLSRMVEFRRDGHRFEHVAKHAPLESAHRLLTANACVSGWSIVEALNRGADIVITGCLSTSAMIAGASSWWHGWSREDYDCIAGAVVVGHLMRGGVQVTPSHSCLPIRELALELSALPIAEIAADGSCVITQQDGHGGSISVESVTAELIRGDVGPHFSTSDAIARLETATIESAGLNRVRISGVRGEAPPSGLDVSMSYVASTFTRARLGIAGLEFEEAADRYLRSLWNLVPEGRDSVPGIRIDVTRKIALVPRGHEDYSAELHLEVEGLEEYSAAGELFRRNVERATVDCPELRLVCFEKDSNWIQWPTRIPARLIGQRVCLDDTITEVSHPCHEA